MVFADEYGDSAYHYFTTVLGCRSGTKDLTITALRHIRYRDGGVILSRHISAVLPRRFVSVYSA